jgi:hypothetical protein
MRIGLNPNRAANPLVWLLLMSVLLSIGSNIYHGLNPHGKTGDRPTSAESPLKAETPQTLMQGGYQRLKRSGNQVSLEITGALARNYLDEAKLSTTMPSQNSKIGKMPRLSMPLEKRLSTPLEKRLSMPLEKLKNSPLSRLKLLP